MLRSIPKMRGRPRIACDHLTRQRADVGIALVFVGITGITEFWYFKR
jgi:hypothetical protein